jgi:hypothetical protein
LDISFFLIKIEDARISDARIVIASKISRNFLFMNFDNSISPHNKVEIAPEQRYTAIRCKDTYLPLILLVDAMKFI